MRAFLYTSSLLIFLLPRARRGRGAVWAASLLVGAVLLAPEASAQFATDFHQFRDGPQNTWLDRTQSGLHRFVWRTARSIDTLAGPPRPAHEYQVASGSLAFALMWNEHEGLEPRIRFRVDLPLPQVNERFHLFIGRFNRDEYVTERNEYSGAFPQRIGMVEEDQTLAGIVYSESGKEGGRFSASAGLRLHSSSIDPYVKTSFRYERPLGRKTQISLKETIFWQRSEKFGLTSRADVERTIGEAWLLRWTTSGTLTQESEGVRGYSTLTATRALPGDRALILRASIEGESGNDVPVHDYGLKVAYRQSVFRDWLVMELRTSLSWPKELPDDPRKPSWGFGIGWEMYFGGEVFSARPLTF